MLGVSAVTAGAAADVISAVCQSGVSASCLAALFWRKAAAETGVAGVSGEVIIGAALNDDDVVRSRRQICWMTIHATSTARHTITATATAAAEMLLSSDSAADNNIVIVVSILITAGLLHRIRLLNKTKTCRSTSFNRYVIVRPLSTVGYTSVVASVRLSTVDSGLTNFIP